MTYFILGILNFVTFVLILIFAFICWRNFGQGMKEMLIQQQTANATSVEMSDTESAITSNNK